MSESMIEGRFWARVQKTHKCWEWTGSKNTAGYGSLRVNGKTRKATHVSVWLRDGVLPAPGTVVCHSCDNPSCVRPDHLWVGSYLENNRDRHAKGRTVLNLSPIRARGEKHGLSKLTAEKVVEIRASQASGRVLSRKYGVSLPTIQAVQKRRVWKHV